MLVLVLCLSKNRIVKRCKWNEDTIFDSDGDIYPCDYFIGNRKYLRGNINSTKVQDICEGKLLVDERGNCKDCWCKYLCGGTCFYNSLKNMDDISLPDPVECKLSKAMKEMSVRFVHKLIDSGVDLFEFARRIGFEVDENVVFNESFFIFIFKPHHSLWMKSKHTCIVVCHSWHPPLTMKYLRIRIH